MKINPNLKTLQQLITKQQFLDYFFSFSNGNYLTNELSPSTLNPTIQDLLYANSSVPGLLYTLNQNTFGGGVYLSNLINFIYDIFFDAIPYNQAVLQINLYNLQNKEYQATLPTILLNNISGYIGLYFNEIKAWIYNIRRFTLATDTVNNNATRTVNKTQNTDNINQSQTINKDSFNPVATSSNIDVEKIPVNKQNQGGLNNINNAATSSATWNTNSNGESSNTEQQEQIQEVDLTQLRELGNESMIKYLKPLFKKIGTLFWVLGNDYWNDDTADLGFNIW